MAPRRLIASLASTAPFLNTDFRKRAAFKSLSKLRLILNSFKSSEVSEILVFIRNVN